MPQRRAAGTTATRIALLHAVAHIEPQRDRPRLGHRRASRRRTCRANSSTTGCGSATTSEAFPLLSDRLAALGAAYGDLPAHDGLWQAAHETRHDLLARLAIVPLVLEARGLDVTPPMIARFDRLGDAESACQAASSTPTRSPIVAGLLYAGSNGCARAAPCRRSRPGARWCGSISRRAEAAVQPRRARAQAGFSSAYYSTVP
ncbi:MAG: DUF455 family protein [Alphaproteobacteria bacterium]